MTNGILKSPLFIDDHEQINELNFLLHDETAEIDDLDYSIEKSLVAIPCRRQFHGGDEVEISRCGDCIVYEKVWMRSLLTIHNVSCITKENDQGIGDYSVARIQCEPGLITLICSEELVIRFSVSSLAITFSDIGFCGRARIERKSTGAECSSSKVC